MAEFCKNVPVSDENRFFVNDREMSSEDEYEREKKDFERKLGTRILIEKESMRTEDGTQIPYMSYDEIINKLQQIREERNASEYAKADPWKVACRNLLYDVYSGVVTTGIFGDRADHTKGRTGKFRLRDFDKDGIPELLLSGTEDDSYWNMYRYDADKEYRHIGDMQYYDEENDRFYSIGGNDGSYLVYYAMILQDGKLIYDTGIDGTVDYPDHSWIRQEGRYDMEDAFQNGYFDGMFYGNRFYDEPASEEEWNSFEAGYEAGLEKYGIKDGMVLTLENIDKELGFPAGRDRSGQEQEAEEGGYTEKELDEMLDSIKLADGKTAKSLGYNWMWLKERDRVRKEDDIYSWGDDFGVDKSLFYGLKKVDWDNDGIDEYCYRGGFIEGLYFDLEGDVLTAVHGFGPYGMGWNDVIMFNGEYWVYEASGNMTKEYSFEKFDPDHKITESVTYGWEIGEYNEESGEDTYYRYSGWNYEDREEISEAEFNRACGENGWIGRKVPDNAANKDPELTERLYKAIKEFYLEKRPALAIWGGLKKELYSVTVAAPDGYVNFRTGPGTDQNIIMPILNEEILPVYEESADGRWLYTEYQGSLGWVDSSQVAKK